MAREQKASDGREELRSILHSLVKIVHRAKSSAERSNNKPKTCVAKRFIQRIFIFLQDYGLHHGMEREQQHDFERCQPDIKWPGWSLQVYDTVGRSQGISNEG